MKRIALILMIIVSCGFAADAGDKMKELTGEIIYISDTVLELKKGKKETVLHFTDTSAVAKGEAELSRNKLELCQIVKITYSTVNSKNEIITVEIIKESVCLK